MTHRSHWLMSVCASSLALGGLGLDSPARAELAAFQHYDQAMALKAQGQLSAAIVELETAHTQDPRNPVIAFDLAYAYRAAERNVEAAKMFAAALALDPSKFQVIEDHAYALKSAGYRKAAAKKFRTVIDNEPKYPQSTKAEKTELAEHMERVRREISYLERRWYADAYFDYRSHTAGTWTPTAENSFAASQAGAEVGYRVLNRARVDAYARGYFAFERDSLRYDDKSLQFGVGLRWRPFEDYDFAVAGERMIKVGSSARDAWLLRASYSWGYGIEQKLTERSWDYTTVYLDAAYIPGDRHYFSLYGEAMQGWRFRFAPDWALTPHVVLAATRTDDLGGIRHLVEGGPGLMLTHWYGADKYHAAFSQVSLFAQYRAVIDDNVHSNDVWIGKLVWSL